MKFLCRFGVHKYTKWIRVGQLGAYGVVCERICLNCGEIKRRLFDIHI